MLPVAMPADLPGGYTMQLRNVTVSDSNSNSKLAGVFEDMDGSLATPTLNFNANNIADIVDPLVNTYFASTRNFINVGCNFDFDPSILDDADNLGSMYAYYKDKFAFKTNLLNRIYTTDGCAAR